MAKIVLIARAHAARIRETLRIQGLACKVAANSDRLSFKATRFRNENSLPKGCVHKTNPELNVPDTRLPPPASSRRTVLSEDERGVRACVVPKGAAIVNLLQVMWSSSYGL